MNQDYNYHLRPNRSIRYGFALPKAFFQIKLLARVCLLLLLFGFYQNQSYGQNNQPWPSFGNSLFFSDNWTSYSNNHIQMGPILNQIGTGELTIEFWMKPRTNDLEQTILHCNPFSGNWWEETLVYYGASNSPNRLNYRIGGAWYYVPDVIPLHQWTHVALVWQNGAVTAYFNGQNKGTGAGNPPTAIPPGNTIIGNKLPSLGNPFGGELDEFVIRNCARNQSQVQSDMYDPMYQGPSCFLTYMNFDIGVGQGNNQGLTNPFGYGMYGGGTLVNFALQANYPSNYIARSPVLSNMVATPGSISGSNGNVLVSANLDNYGSGTNGTNSNGHAGQIPIVERGFITSSTNGIPLLFNQYGTAREVVSGSISLGNYTKNILLPLGNFLRVRPYAILNDNTVGYGNEIYMAPMCGVFSGSNVSVSTTPTTANFSWSGAGTYDWKLVAAGAGVNGTAIASASSASTTSAAITGLTPATNYDFYIKSSPSGCTTWYPIACTTQSCTVPSGLSISNLLYGTATVNWTAINGINNFSYKVVDAGAGVNGTAVASGTSTTNSANITGLTSGQSYDVYVESNCTQSISSGWSNALNFTTLACTTVPSGLTISNILYGGATITWTAINGVNGFNYKVVNSGAGINGTALASGSSPTNSKVITGLLGGGTYDVYVQAICTPGVISNWTTTPASFTTLSCNAVPTNVLATNVSYSTANASWASSVSNVQGYNWKVVDYGMGPNAPAAASGFSATTSTTITGMSPNTFYDLYIQTACDNLNQSAWSSSPLTLVTTACNPPTNLIAFSVGYTNVTINWATISNVQGYTWKVVLAGAGSNGTAVQTGTSTGGPVTITGLNSATAYQVYIRTNCDASATSVWSAPTSFTTNTCNVPTNITLSSVGFDVATLSWTPVPNVLSYNYKVVAAGAGINATAISAGTSTAPGAIAAGLSASTSYDIYLQTNCNANVTSAWTIPITFTTLNCNPPINITPSNVNFTGANFSWTAIPNAAGYEWKVVLAGAGVNATAISSGTTASDSVSVTGLTAGTDYDFYIKTNCSGAISSSYANPYSFTTQNCITPTSLAIANILPGSATLTWSSVNFSAKYYWKVVLRGAGVNAPAVATDSSTTSSAVIKGLTGLTAYEAYVRINCGPTTTSPWSAPIAFSTPLLPFNAPWTLGNTGWFNGVDDYATIALGLPNPNDFTIEFWARVENEQPDVAQSWFNTTDSYIPLIDRSSVLQTPYSIRYNPVTGYVKVFRTDGTNTPAEIIGTTSIKDGTYHHIAVTRNSLTYELKLYIDGILDGTEVDLTNVTINPTGAQTLIAARTIFTNNSKLHFKGNIDDLRFWNVVREISDIQNAKETPLLGTEAGLIAYYDMENVISGNGQTIYSIVTPPISATNALSTGTSTTPIFAHPCLTFNAKELGIKTTPTTATLKFTGNPLFFAGFDWKITDANAGANTLGLFSGTTADTVTIAGFDPGIQYDLYVKTPCTDIWQGPISLTTQNVWHNALHFDGTNDNVSTGNGSSFATISTALSLELWVRPEDNTGTHYLFDKETASSSGGIALYTLNGIPTFDLKTSAWTSLSATDALPLNTWSHIAAVYTGTEMLLYVNGRVVGSTAKTGNIAPIATNGLIGKKYNNTGYFSGMLDECRIWNIARSTNQIQSNLYSFPAPNSTGFVAYYPLNESNISAAQDITSNANNASLSGFALIGSTSNWVPRSPLLSDPVIGLMVDNNVTVYDSVLNQGTAPILEKGFLWSVTNTTASSLVLGSSGTNRIVVSGTAFQADMLGLPLGAVIGYRGYAYSEDGIDYSSVMQNIPILCPAPYGIAASNVNTNSVQVNWTSLAGGTKSGVCWRRCW